MGFICTTFIYQYLAEIAYTAVIGKHYNPYKSNFVFDFTIFIIFFTYICITFATNLRETISEGPNIVTWEEKAPIYCKRYVLNGVHEHGLLICGVIALYLKLFSYARFNEYLGPFLGISRRVISDFLIFFLLYLGNLGAFALIAESSFREFDEYNTVEKAYKTLFFASLGSMGSADFDLVEKSRLGPHFGLTFMITFLVVNLGLFMSLFIAVVTVLFSVHKEDSNIY